MSRPRGGSAFDQHMHESRTTPSCGVRSRAAADFTVDFPPFRSGAVEKEAEFARSLRGGCGVWARARCAETSNVYVIRLDAAVLKNAASRPSFAFALAGPSGSHDSHVSQALCVYVGATDFRRKPASRTTSPVTRRTTMPEHTRGLMPNSSSTQSMTYQRALQPRLPGEELRQEGFAVCRTDD